MIVELAPEDFADVLPLYHATEFRFPLISAVLERGQRGQVFADRKNNPRSAIVVNNFGFMFYLGETNPEFDDALMELLETGSNLKPSYLLWYSPPENWQNRLAQLGARVRERVRFEFHGRQLTEPVPCALGFEIRKLDAELVPKTEKFGIALGSRFWSSPDDFAENGLGFCLLKDNQIVSLCYAAAISEGFAEIDVITDEAFRAHGLANIVSQHFIRECGARKITPTWDCFAYNTASLRLALKLGFAEVRRYPFYTFNVPLPQRGT